MSSSESGVTCGTHGEANATFVCRHLISRPKQRWFCGYPTKNYPWPDAWCESCNRHHVRKGRWTKGIESEIKLLCHHCYEDKRSKNLGQSTVLANISDICALTRVTCASLTGAVRLTNRLGVDQAWDFYTFTYTTMATTIEINMNKGPRTSQ